MRLSFTPGDVGREDELGSYVESGGAAPAHPADWTLPPAESSASELVIGNIKGALGELGVNTVMAHEVGQIEWTIKAGSARLADRLQGIGLNIKV